MKANKMNVIMVNGTNPNADEVMAQVKETGCNVIVFTGIGKAKARKFIDSLPYGKLRFGAFRRLDSASEEWVNDNFNVVSTIGDFCKGKGRKTAKVESNISEEEAKKMADKFVEQVKLNRESINLYGYTVFMDLAMECGATKTMKRGTKKYAYFGKLYVRY